MVNSVVTILLKMAAEDFFRKLQLKKKGPDFIKIRPFLLFWIRKMSWFDRSELSQATSLWDELLNFNFFVY